MLPQSLREKLGRPRDNYASPEAYKRSKEIFTHEVSNWARGHFGASLTPRHATSHQDVFATFDASCAKRAWSHGFASAC
jgi:hypothetical protein